ncbi:MAG: inositol monophosphatase family protein [Pirellulaceae bacterium]|nr:inositol monophosphatase family protein [Pirellulaceae bacterium]
MPDFLEVCVEAAQAGGEVLLDWQHRFKPREKGPKDLVTEADVAAQEAIRGILLRAFPDHDFLAEEEAADRKSQGLAPIPPRRSEFRWIVDPLDGTANYVHKLQNFAVSIALEQGSELIAGCILDPISRECFTARRGGGALLNGQAIRASQCQSLDEAMVAVSFSANVPRGSIEITRFIEVLHAAQSVRRLGSAALNLCYVASGRLDAYWATSVAAWDVAAGILILREAGGIVTQVDGKPLDIEKPEMLASCGPAVHAQALAMLRRAEQVHRGKVEP